MVAISEKLSVAQLIFAGKASRCLVGDLRADLERNNLLSTGKKEDLIKRLQLHYTGSVGDGGGPEAGSSNLAANEKALQLFTSGEPLTKMLVAELRDALSYYNLPTEGKKAELVLRLCAHLAEVAVVPGSVSNLSEDVELCVLMVAEKPIMASQIAKKFSNFSYPKMRKGLNDCKVHEFSGEFMERPAFFKMTSTFGHIMRAEFAPEFQNWHNHEPEALFTCPIEKIECDSKSNVQKFLAEEAKGCDFVVLWLDCDQEGENICFEVIDAIRNSLKRRGPNIEDQVFRAHFSSLDEVERAFKNLIRPNLKQALSVDAKKELDLRIGVAFSRFQTLYFRKRNRDKDVKLVSFGPCQTPTLAFCVEQHEKVAKFKSTSSCTLSCMVNIGGVELKVDYASGKALSEEECDKIAKKIKKSAKLKEIQSKRHEKNPPKPMNTVELLKAASTRLDLGPKETMQVAQNLYQKGFISYPRTETTTYPKDLPAQRLMERAVGDDQLQKWSDGRLSLKEICVDGTELCETKKGVDKGDHPPIYPISRPNYELQGDEGRLLSYIGQYFGATFMKPCSYDTMTLIFSVGDDDKCNFQTQVRRIVDPGYTLIMPEECVAADDERLLDALSVGSSVTVSDVKIQKKKSSPPQHLTESELISKMEHYSIGTDASIPTHIENILKTYVTLESGRRLVPTPLGIALIKAYRELDEELALPTVRADVERKLAKIASGEAEFGAVRDEILDLYHAKFKTFTKNFNKVEHLFEGCFPIRTDFSSSNPSTSSAQSTSNASNPRKHRQKREQDPQRDDDEDPPRKRRSGGGDGEHPHDSRLPHHHRQCDNRGPNHGGNQCCNLNTF